MIKQVLLGMIALFGIVGLAGCGEDNKDLTRASAEEKVATENKYYIEITSADEAIDFLGNEAGFFVLLEIEPNQPDKDTEAALKQAAIQTEVPVYYYRPTNYDDSGKVQDIVDTRNNLQYWKNGDYGDSISIARFYVNDPREIESISIDQAVEQYSLFLNEYID